MRVLITRPRIDAEPFAARLHALGHATILEPLIEILFRDGPALDLRGVQALLFTSANGARAAARRTKDRAIRVIAVGETTAAEAKVLGFQNVGQNPGEGVDGLAAHVRIVLKPNEGTLLHPTGTVTAGDLKASLAPFGYSVRTEEIYEARAAQSLSGAVTAELGAGVVAAATFFSARTAGLFATLVGNAALAPACRTMTAFALSQAVANALVPLVFQRVSVAPRPTADAMLGLIGRA